MTNTSEVPTPDDEPIKGPRRWLEAGQSFTTDQVTWQSGTTLREEARIEAAVRQHRVATAVRVELARSGKSTADLAEKVGLSVHQLRRMMRGEAHMPLDVAGALVKAIGYKTTFGIKKRPEGDVEEEAMLEPRTDGGTSGRSE